VISSNAAAMTVLATPTVNAMSNQVYCKNTAAPATPITANYSSARVAPFLDSIRSITAVLQ
jgi:hypothetical protein